jgi:hypothetical protein
MPRGKQHLSHKEIMKNRNDKKKKKSASIKTKEYHMKEFLRLSKIDEKSKKDTAMSIMEIVEDIKDEGMNDKRYMDIMNQLMNLHKEDESEGNHNDEINHNNYVDNNYVDNNYVNYVNNYNTNIYENIINRQLQRWSTYTPINTA